MGLSQVSRVKRGWEGIALLKDEHEAELPEGGYPTDLVRGEEMGETKQGSVRGTPETGNGEPLLSALPKES